MNLLRTSQWLVWVLQNRDYKLTGGGCGPTPPTAPKWLLALAQMRLLNLSMLFLTLDLGAAERELALTALRITALPKWGYRHSLRAWTTHDRALSGSLTHSLPSPSGYPFWYKFKALTWLLSPKCSGVLYFTLHRIAWSYRVIQNRFYPSSSRQHTQGHSPHPTWWSAKAQRICQCENWLGVNQRSCSHS